MFLKLFRHGIYFVDSKMSLFGGLTTGLCFLTAREELSREIKRV